VKVVYEGETVDADELEFEVQQEAVGYYKTGDGARIEFKHDVKTIYRLCDQKKEDGSPIYLVTGVAVLKTTVT
jgi:hypothetical protein